jgi:predicted transcriptional regulator
MKRERLKIIHDILKAIQNGKNKPTHIMYKANLSHQMLEEYLKDLIYRKLIIVESQKKSRHYQLTKKGHQYVQEYKIIEGFIDSFGLGD